MRRRVAASILALGILSASAWGNMTPTTDKRASATGTDPATGHALLRIARQFNDDYAANDAGAVYDRWDSQSRTVIGRAEYVRRHRECPTAPGRAVIQGAARAGHWWLVHYSISGTVLTDYWHYEHRRWLFDLLHSNPEAVRLYRLPAAKYFAAVGCASQH